MIEIAISGELANESPPFMAGCAQRGHRVEVFESIGRTGEIVDVPVADSRRDGARPSPAGVGDASLGGR